MKDELQNIIQSCVKGDRCAQEKLFRQYSPVMYGVCLRYSRNAEEARDALQDGFIKVYEKIHQFKFSGSFEGWVRKIMVNTVIEGYRKNRKIEFVEDIPEIIEEQNNNEDGPDISENDLMNIVQELPSQYRIVFNLYAFEEKSHKEIASLLGINEGTSKSNLSRARAILQRKVNELVQNEVKFG